MMDRKRNEESNEGSSDDSARDAATPGNGGPSTNRGQVPDGLEGSIMEPPSERKKSDNAGDRPAGDQRRTDEL